MNNNFYIEERYIGERIDKALSILFTDLSRSHIAKLIQEEKILVNHKSVSNSYLLKKGDFITINDEEKKELEVIKENIPLDIVYEDEDILIINKPQGMVVHPACGHYQGTLVNAIMYHCSDLSGINGVLRPGIVHRIDKDTSGLICIAKNDRAHNYLSEQLKTHTMRRKYVALVKGVIKEEKGLIDLPLGRDTLSRKKFAVNKEGKVAITHFKVLKRFKNNTLLECTLETGRTHQIRVHLAYIGHPVEGDPLYYGKNYNHLYNNGQLLVAKELTLIHPSNHQEMTFKIDLPSYFQEVIDRLSL